MAHALAVGAGSDLAVAPREGALAAAVVGGAAGHHPGGVAARADSGALEIRRQGADLRLGLGVLAGGRPARHHVDDAEEGAGAVQHRPRPAHDLDALDVLEVDVEIVADVALARDDVVVRVAVDQHQHALGVVTGRREAVEPQRLVRPVVRADDAADAAQRVGQRQVAQRADLLGGDDGDRRRRILDRGEALVGGFDQRLLAAQADVQVGAAPGLDGDGGPEGVAPFVLDLDQPLAGGHAFDDGRRETHLAAVDAHQRAVQVGAHDDGPGGRRQRRQRHVDGGRRVGRDLDRDARLGVTGRRDEQIVAPRDQPRGRLSDDHQRPVGRPLAHGRAGRQAAEHDRAVDALQPGRDLLLGALGQLDGDGDRVVAGQVEQHRGAAGRQRQAAGRRPQRAQIPPVDVDGRSGRVGRDLQQRQLRAQLVDGGLDGGALGGRRFAAGQLGPGAEGLVVQLELLEAARDVELHVAVGDQAVRRVELDQRLVEAALPVKLIAAREVELRLVRDLLGAGGGRGQREKQDDEDGRRAPAAHRSDLMSSVGIVGRPGWSGGAGRLRACRSSRRRRAGARRNEDEGSAGITSVL